MKITQLCLILASIVFSNYMYAQKSGDIKATVKDKKAKNEINIQDEKQPHFIQFGIMSRNHESFKNKYGVDVFYQNCVITPFVSKQAKENNILLAKSLTEKYGEAWKKDLDFTPYGL